MRLLKVELGPRSYRLSIGREVFGACAHFLAQGGYSPKALLLTDETVDKLYADKFLAALDGAGLTVAKVAAPPGEQAKSLAWAEKIYTVMIEHGMDRKSPVIALGGGVVGDLAGFVAATFMRGVPFVQAPTTLLAQTDSSVGGKVAINHPAGKNMIGAFHQPAAVFISTDVLETLSAREYASGLAEVVKYACLAGGDWLDFLEENYAAVQERNTDVLEEIIVRCCRYKADIVAEDETEDGKRIWLNLGHTYGHAVETAGGFSRYTHGEAVSIGLCGALLLSNALGICGDSLTKRAESLLLSLGLPVKAEGLPVDVVCQNLLRDKKALNNKLRWVLLTAAGQPLVSPAPDDKVREIAGRILC